MLFLRHSLEQISIFGSIILVLGEIGKGSHLFEFIVPHILLQNNFLIFTQFFGPFNQRIIALPMIYFLGEIASIFFLIGGKLVMFFLFDEVVQAEVLGCFVESFEELHNVSESDVYFQLIHESDDFYGLNFALNVEKNGWSVE